VAPAATGQPDACADAPAPLFVNGPMPVGVAPITIAPVSTPAAAPTAMPAPSAGIAANLGVAALGAPGMVAAPVFAQPQSAAPVLAGGAAAAPLRMTTVAPGGSQADADQVERTLGVLRQSPSGAQLVDRMLAVGAKVTVIGDAEFTALGQADAHAFFDPNDDTIYLRRSQLSGGDPSFAAVALAHEGTHLLDDVAKLDAPFFDSASRAVAAAGGFSTAQGIATQEQTLFELTMIREARAFTFAGQVARDLGTRLPASDPTAIAAGGGNDPATYGRVWTALLQSSYNPDRRAANVRNF
ncbi:MAG: hypothetical protein JWM25_1050, partial [Thermoleophilia bacterium]|nr:hypothetical protein [Thermoleophilia bacterium]